ncbi:MAG: hypothetical protein ACOCXC_01015 [Fibrobacterota bacterium]
MGVLVKLSVLIAVLLVLGDFGGLGMGEAHAQEREEKPVLTTAAGWSVIGGIVILAAAGTGAFFLHRHNKRQAFLRDSIATVLEGDFASAQKLEEEERFKEAAEAFRAVLGRWEEYARYRPEGKRPAEFDSTKLVRKIDGCDYLDRHLEFIHFLRDSLPKLPLDPYELVKLDRLEVRKEAASLRDTISAVKEQSEGFGEEFEYGFKAAVTALDSIDQIFRDVYKQQALNFSLKSRFFYNRAMETKDTADLRRYVQDCDYYQCEKAWCEKARLILDPPVAADTVGDTLVKQVKDTVLQQYRRVMQSGRLDRLEAFLDTYDSGKFRKYRTVVDSAKQFAVQLRKEVDEEMAYNRAHPLFSNANVSQLKLQFSGVGESEQQVFRSVLEQLGPEVAKISEVRFPAFITVDCSQKRGTVTLTGFVNCQKDVSTVGDSAGSELMQIPGAESAMLFLEKFRHAVEGRIQKAQLSEERKSEAVERVGNLSLVVRLRKNSQDYITFYARVKEKQISWYDFFDLSVSDKRDVRISSESVPLVGSSDENAAALVESFFGE